MTPNQQWADGGVVATRGGNNRSGSPTETYPGLAALAATMTAHELALHYGRTRDQVKAALQYRRLTAVPVRVRAVPMMVPRDAEEASVWASRAAAADGCAVLRDRCDALAARTVRDGRTVADWAGW